MQSDFFLRFNKKNDIKLPNYNGLTDKYLIPYFTN